MIAISKSRLFSIALIVGLGLVSGLLSASCFAQTYTVTDLGAIRHGSARVHGINANQQAVGRTGFPHGADTHAFFWQKQGGMRDLGTLPGGDYSAAFGINDSGQVAGTSNTADSMHAFIWTSAAGMQDLGVLSSANSAQGLAINNLGDVVGSSGTHAAMWSNGTITDLGTLGGPTSEAHGINNHQQIVGFADTAADGQRAFIWSNGSMQQIGVLPGDIASRADHINDAGTVVGTSEGINGTTSFIWTQATGMQPIGSLSGSTYSEAFAINDLGQVVGESGSSLGTRAFLWTSTGGMIDLNEHVTGLNPHIVLTGAFSINDKGEIVAFGVNSPNTTRHDVATMDSHLHSGPIRVFLLTPQ